MDWNIFLYLVVALVINIGMFAIAYKRQTDALTDISYAVTFIALAVGGLIFATSDTVKTVAVIMVCAWAVRLGSFLLYRIRKTGRDQRFDEMRSNFRKFLQFWILQGVSVWLILLPVLFLLGNHDSVSMSLLGGVGILLWLLGLGLESAADVQKFRFARSTTHTHAWIDEGVWKYSRHPNYFGEICIWVGVYLFVFPGLTGWQHIVGLIGPLFITSLLLFVSGIPKLEKSADERWGQDKDYQKYKRRTSILIPLPKKR